MNGQVYTYNGTVQESLPCNTNITVNYHVVMEHIQGDCGSWKFSVTFPQLSNGSTYEPNLKDVEWRNVVTNENEYGSPAFFRVSSPIAYIEMTFVVKDNCVPAGKHQITLDPMYISQQETCYTCRSVINYCDMTNCTSMANLNVYERLIGFKVYEHAIDDCYSVNGSNNPGGVFHFPYKVYSDNNCELDPSDHDLYDFVNDLNQFLTPAYGHSGYAYIVHYNAEFSCKMKIKVIDSDIILNGVNVICYTLTNDFDQNGLCINASIGSTLTSPVLIEAEVQECSGVDISGVVCMGSNANEEDMGLDLVSSGDEYLELFEVKVSPTQTDDRVKIDITDDNIGYEIEIRNLVGDIMQKSSIVGQNTSLSIGVKDYMPGLYFIIVKSMKTGRSKIEKFIKL